MKLNNKKTSPENATPCEGWLHLTWSTGLRSAIIQATATDSGDMWLMKAWEPSQGRPALHKQG